MKLGHYLLFALILSEIQIMILKIELSKSVWINCVALVVYAVLGVLFFMESRVKKINAD